jgi:HTH-type transcriptional regulator / antitoxin HigA
MEVMPARANRKRIDPDKYVRLIATALPIPPKTQADNERLTKLLLAFDEREEEEKEGLTPEEEAFTELLAIVVSDFEAQHYQFPAVAPHEALKALMEDRGLRHKDVWPVVGNKGLTTEILNGRRKIGLDLAKRLAVHFRVPVEMFV